MFNFDTIVFKYYKDMTVALELLKQVSMILFMKIILKDGQETIPALTLMMA